MEFRKSTKSDVIKIMEIVKQAKNTLNHKGLTNGKMVIQMKKL